MPAIRFKPPANNKAKMARSDPRGWYQITVFSGGKLKAICRWWSGRYWCFWPGAAEGWPTRDLGDVRGITRLVEATD